MSRGTTAWCLLDRAGNGDRFAAFASEFFDLALTPGSFFGDDRGFRVTLGFEPERFAAALEALERAAAAWDQGGGEELPRSTGSPAAVEGSR